MQSSFNLQRNSTVESCKLGKYTRFPCILLMYSLHIKQFLVFSNHCLLRVSCVVALSKVWFMDDILTQLPKFNKHCSSSIIAYILHKIIKTCTPYLYHQCHLNNKRNTNIRNMFCQLGVLVFKYYNYFIHYTSSYAKTDGDFYLTMMHCKVPPPKVLQLHILLCYVYQLV